MSNMPSSSSATGLAAGGRRARGPAAVTGAAADQPPRRQGNGKNGTYPTLSTFPFGASSSSSSAGVATNARHLIGGASSAPAAALACGKPSSSAYASAPLSSPSPSAATDVSHLSEELMRDDVGGDETMEQLAAQDRLSGGQAAHAGSSSGVSVGGGGRIGWSEEETMALKLGARLHGKGSWARIKKDPRLSSHLTARSNVQLKDKWRNLVGGDAAPFENDVKAETEMLWKVFTENGYKKLPSQAQLLAQSVKGLATAMAPVRR